jgi:hypothetical protein
MPYFNGFLDKLNSTKMLKIEVFKGTIENSKYGDGTCLGFMKHTISREDVPLISASSVAQFPVNMRQK